MQFKQLNPGYKQNPAFYQAFLADQLADSDFFSDELLSFPTSQPFPIYMGTKYQGDKKQAFIQAIQIIAQHYLQTSRELHFEEVIWHSYFVSCHREYLIATYPAILDSQADFENIVLKKFDWESYIYKCVLVAEYVHDYTVDPDHKQSLYELVYHNLDLFNYMIKYPLFRTGDFVLKFLEAINELGLSEKMKAKIPNRPDLGADERYGRRVLAELNQSYPVVLVPMLNKTDLKTTIQQILEQYEEGEIDLDDKLTAAIFLDLDDL
ncbi:MAG: hypothetical protein ACRDD4_09890 [Culicoidibacterales bacterium]